MRVVVTRFAAQMCTCRMSDCLYEAHCILSLEKFFTTSAYVAHCILSLEVLIWHTAYCR
jgi:hypothetical protein